MAAASEAGAVAAAVAAAEAATAATAINKTHTFCEGDAYTHTLTHISDFSPSSPAGCTVVKSTLIYITAMCVIFGAGIASTAACCQLVKIEF